MPREYAGWNYATNRPFYANIDYSLTGGTRQPWQINSQGQYNPNAPRPIELRTETPREENVWEPSPFLPQFTPISVARPSWSEIMAQAPQITTQPYRGETSVNLTPGQQDTINLVNQLISGQTGQFRGMLEGQQNRGLLEAGVIEPAYQELTQRVLPGLATQFSGGPYGAGYNTGARVAAQREAVSTFSNQAMALRYQEANNALQRALQAGAQLPAYFGIQDTERINALQNLEREITTHFQNQNLSVATAQANLGFVNSLLQYSGMTTNLDLSVARLNQAAEENRATLSQNWALAQQQQAFNLQQLAQQGQIAQQGLANQAFTTALQAENQRNQFGLQQDRFDFSQGQYDLANSAAQMGFLRGNAMSQGVTNPFQRQQLFAQGVSGGMYQAGYYPGAINWMGRAQEAAGNQYIAGLLMSGNQAPEVRPRQPARPPSSAWDFGPGTGIFVGGRPYEFNPQSGR